jgi:hypothetical protein
MGLTRLTKDNFVQYDGPKFEVYDHWYNLIVDALNAQETTGGTTPAAGTVSISERGDGNSFTTTLTLTNFIIGPLAAAAAANVCVPPTALYVFPAGSHIEEYFYASLSLTCLGDTVNADVGLGSVAGDDSAFAALADATVGITVEDRLTGFTAATLPAGGAVATSMGFHTAGYLIGAVANNVAASIKNVFLNASGTWHANNTGNLTASGTVVIKWVKLGVV